MIKNIISYNDIDQMQINFQGGVDSIYDACVAKGSTPASTSLADVVAGIMAIPTGITPSGTLSITSNNTYDVTNYASASVNVPTYITTAINAGGNDVWKNGKNQTYSQSKSITLQSGYTKFLVFAASWGDGGAGAITLSTSGRVNAISRAGSNNRSQIAVGMYSKTKKSTLSVTASASNSTAGDSSCCCGLMLIACPVYAA